MHTTIKMWMLSVLLMGSLLWIPSIQAQERWALLIGINDYIAGGDKWDLRGCENDVRLMQEILITKFGFQPDHIKVLLSDQATRSNIIAAIKTWLIDQARPSDTVVLHYSGHGSQIYDDNGDEKDGIDEVIVPVDISLYRPGKEIRDDELSALLDQIRATDITVIMDACHSGTGTRGLDVVPRFLELEYPAPRGLPPGEEYGNREIKDDASDGDRKFTFLAGCSANETSGDTYFYEHGSRFYAGVFTYNLASALREAQPGETYGDLMGKVVRDVKARGYWQTPQIEGHKNKLIFANMGSEIPAQQCVPIRSLFGDRVTLPIGAVGGATVGSIYKVVGDQGDREIGRVKLTAVGDHTSKARIIAGQDVVQAGQCVYEIFHGLGEEKLFVLVGDFGDKTINRKIRDRLSELSYVSIVKRGEYYDRILTGRVKESAAMSFITGYKTVEAWLISDGVPSRKVTSKEVSEIINALRPLLENAYAIKKLTRLDNPNPPFRIRLWCSRESPEGTSQRAQRRMLKKTLDLKIGDSIYFTFESERDAYLTLFNVDSHGSITILFPNSLHPLNRVLAGKRYTIPTPEMGFEIKMAGPAGQEMVKAVATDYPVDLDALNAKTTTGLFRSLEGGEAFSENLSRAMMLVVTPPQQKVPEGGISLEHWATDYVIVHVSEEVVKSKK